MLRVLHANAAGVILARYCPAGDAEPIGYDWETVKRAEQALHLVETTFIDYLVVRGATACSLLDHGWVPSLTA